MGSTSLSATDQLMARDRQARIEVTDSPLEVSFAGVRMSPDELMKNIYAIQCRTLMNVAADRSEDAQDRLAVINDARDMLVRARKKKEDAGKGSSVMDYDMVQYFKSHDLEYSTKGDDNKHNKDEWDVNIASLQTYLDKLSSDNDLKLTKMKTIVNSLNEAKQAGNSFIDKAAQVMTGIVKE